MKKNFNAFVAACAAFAIVFSCTKAENPVYGSQDGENSVLAPLGQVTVDALLNDLNTKVSFAPTYVDGKPESVVLAWAAGDKLRIYNHADRTQYADLELDATCVGQKRGLFSGEITFAASSYDVEVFNGTLDYAVQTQPSDASAASLKYLASASAVTSLTTINFTEYSSVLAIAAKMPQGVAAQVTSVDITASDNVFNGGKTLTINLAQKGDAEGDDILHLFATLPQGSQEIVEGTSLLVKFNAPDTDHKVYTRYVELAASDFAAGKLNTINVNATASATHAGVVSCDGSSEKAYLVGDVYQMQAVKALLSADALTYIELVDNIDLKDVAWTSIDAKVNLNGNNHTISNLTATGGLFATLDGTVQNLVIDKAKITSTTDNAGVLANVANDGVMLRQITITDSELNNGSYINNGGLVGYLNGGTIEDVTVTCSVTGTSQIGGLIGNMQKGDLKNCHAYGDVTASIFYTGGLVGDMQDGSVINCSANGDVVNTRSNYSHAGGLIGRVVKGTVSSSYATGNVNATGAVEGGLIGNLGAATLSNCYATGIVTNTKTSAATTGGLIGEMAGATVNKCYATGDVSINNQIAGGLVGKANGGTISQCYAINNVTAPNHYVGGLVAITEGTVIISECYTTVSLGTDAASRRGGLIGNINNGATSITNCYSSGSIVSNTYSGCFIGGIEAAATLSVTNSYTNASITGAKWTACVFCGTTPADLTSYSSGFIGWNVSNRQAWSYGNSMPEGNYMGKEGTISAKAKDFDWDETIWDLSKDVPTLKCFAK